MQVIKKPARLAPGAASCLPLVSLQQLVQPDFSIHADSLWYALFKRADGKRTYLAWNGDKTVGVMRFSDGSKLQVERGRLGGRVCCKNEAESGPHCGYGPKAGAGG